MLIPKDGRARVVDFGLALRVEGKPRIDEMSVGTPAYMAPEQWRGEPCSATDIWALGLVLFELCADRQPFESDSIAELVEAVTSPSDTPSVDSFANVPAEISSLLGRCLQKDPAERPSAVEVAELVAEVLFADRRDRAREQSPFRGLLAFGEQHSSFFFGREAETGALLERIRQHPVIGVIGPSGAGKSSFVQAGVIPRLHEQERWLVLRLRPGASPLRSMASRLAAARSERDDLTPNDQAEVAKLSRKLREAPRTLSLELREIAAKRRAKILLLVDQLEELFTMCPDEELQRNFLRAMCLAADDRSDPVRVIFTIRDDFLGRMGKDPETREGLAQLMVIHSPERAVLADVVCKPLEVVGYRYDDPSLIHDMVVAVQGERACLPLLQFTTRKLWEKRDKGRKLLRRVDYEQIGGVVGALAKHADEVLEGLSSEELLIARELLLRLVTAERTRRVETREHALQGLGPEAERLLQRLVEARLITVHKTNDEQSGGAQLELAHEALIDSWTRLSRWIDESKEDLAFLREVGRAAELWDQRGRRQTELWQGEGLADAARRLARREVEPPDLIKQFLGEGHTRQARGVRRRNLLVVSVIAGLAAIALVLAVQKREADYQRDRAEQRGAEALRRGAKAAWGQGNVLEARALLRMALQIEDHRGARALWWQLSAEPLVWQKTLSSRCYGVVFSADGQTLAAACQDKSIHLFDRRTAAMRTLRGHTDQVLTLDMAPTGDQLASGSWSGELRLWDLRGNSNRVLAGHSKAVRKLRFSPDGTTIASASYDNTLRLWDARTGRALRVIEGHRGGVSSLCFSPDGKTIASGGRDKTVRLWDSATGKPIRVIAGHGGAVYGVSFSPDGKQLAATGDKIVHIWDAASGKHVRKLTGHLGVVSGVSFSPDGTLLASRGTDGTVRFWDSRTGEPAGQLPGHMGSVSGQRFSPDGKQLATVSKDTRVRLWSVTPLTTRTSTGHALAVNGVAFSPDGKTVASGGGDKIVRQWDVASGLQRRVFKGHTATVRGVQYSPDGSTLASTSFDMTVRLWDLASGRPARALHGHPAAIWNVAFSPGGKTLASVGAESGQLWDLISGRRLKLEALKTGATAIAYSSDGKQLAAGGADRTVRLLDTTGQLIQVLEGHADFVNGVSFGPDSSFLATASSDMTVRIWDLPSGRQRWRGRANGRLYGVSVHPDGDRLATPSSDGTARIWNVKNGKYLDLVGHRGEVNRTAFSPDGKLIATTGDDATLRLWLTDTARPFWHAPVMLNTPPRLLSHRGWASIEPAATKPAALADSWAPAARATLEKKALFAAQSGSGEHLCVHTFDGTAQLWDLAGNKLVAEHRAKALEQVLELPSGCAARSSEQVWLLSLSGQVHKLKHTDEPVALGHGQEGQLLVATTGEILVVNAAGELLRRHQSSVGIAALATIGTSRAEPPAPHPLVVGFTDGNIELMPAEGARQQPQHSFEHVPSSPPVRMLAGPLGTLIVGYANGAIGMWDLHDGSRLAHTRLHGPVVHMLLASGKLYAATSLGDATTWDLSALYRDYCGLLRDVWKHVPVLWKEGRAVLAKPSPKHRCAERPR